MFSIFQAVFALLPPTNRKRLHLPCNRSFSTRWYTDTHKLKIDTDLMFVIRSNLILLSKEFATNVNMSCEDPSIADVTIQRISISFTSVTWDFCLVYKNNNGEMNERILDTNTRRMKEGMRTKHLLSAVKINGQGNVKVKERICRWWHKVVMNFFKSLYHELLELEYIFAGALLKGFPPYLRFTRLVSRRTPRSWL